MGGLFFALHPLCAEPVNYISSRSELMAGLGCLGALWFYMGSVQEASRRLYVLSLACFALGLLSKSIAIMALLWPAVWDWQRSRTFRWAAYAPFAGIALPLSVGRAPVYRARRIERAGADDGRTDCNTAQRVSVLRLFALGAFFIKR